MDSWKNQIALKTLAPFIALYVSVCVLRSGAKQVDALFGDWESVVAIGAVALGMAMFQDLFPASWKEALVFWRLKDRLPAYRAFDAGKSYGDMLDRDEVKDVAQREVLSPREQQRVFYRLYHRYRATGSVANSSYRYLQWRELAFLSLISAILIFLRYAWSRGANAWLPWELTSYGLAICGLSIFAARKASQDLITYVLLTEYLEDED